MVDLGFVEKTGERVLSPLHFPSKVGGKPIWLDCAALPTAEDLTCGVCKRVMSFVLQVYAPNEANESCFHRTIFLFSCRNGGCYSDTVRCFKVLRSQLKRENDFYSREATADSISDLELTKMNEDFLSAWLPNLCIVCGCYGSKRCGSCKVPRYCSKEHQTMDWKEGHKEICSKLENQIGKNLSSSSSTFLLPEFELVTEPEPMSKHEDISPTEDERLKAYQQFVESKGAELSCQNMNEEEIQRFVNSKIDESSDKYFQSFKERISHEPEQVLRYSLNGCPLWVSEEHIPKEEDIPLCICGAKRQFEFQVLPQLLYHLKVDSLNEKSMDWGTLAIYTCSANCNDGPHYHTEFVWKQDFSNQNL